MNKLLIANRGEIAIRIMHAAAELGIATVAVYSDDDAQALHPRKADEAVALGAKGVAAYLDIARIIAIAKETGADAIHPGYGFLSERADFGRACEDAGIVFVGPTPDVLATFGDKAAARALAEKSGAPLMRGISRPTTVAEAEAFLAELGPDGAMMIKAIAGGGGRGMRVVRAGDDVAALHAQASAEALGAFGDGGLYVEEFMPAARHVEVQVAGDGKGGVTHLWERECSIQRRNQKIVEIAPAPGLDPKVRAALLDAALSMAKAVNYRSLGTFEFLVDAGGSGRFAFIEANARLQVEHTVTEEVTGFDLVQTQLRIAGGATLRDCGLAAEPAQPRGFAIQLRVNMETIGADGTVKPTGGTLSAFEIPFGPGIRVDTSGFAGYRTSPAFDSLLAKLICHAATPDYADAVRKAYRALCEFRIEGVRTNIGLLQNLLKHPDVVANAVSTRFLDTNIASLVGEEAEHRRLFVHAGQEKRLAGIKVDRSDPLALFGIEGPSRGSAGGAAVVAPEGTVPVTAPMQGTIVSLVVRPGDVVPAGRTILVMDAMKMQHDVVASVAGTVRELAIEAGDTVYEGDALLFIEEGEVDLQDQGAVEEVDLDHIRPDLQEVVDRHFITLDAGRPDAVGKRRRFNYRTARENIEDLVDPGSFLEYGALVVAAQRTTRPMDDLIRTTQADGMICGLATINGDIVPPERAKAAVLAYDYTVFAGTQGRKNHEKKDRIFKIAKREKRPVVFYCEGGGGRPGQTDLISSGSLMGTTFHQFPELSGLVPLIGIAHGRCFAGNAAILGCCDVIIATKSSNIGMGGPAMIEGGGLGVFAPEEIGPNSVQKANGVIDIEVEDEIEATAVAKKYLSYFQGPVKDWSCADQRLLRRAIPENRLKVYEVRDVIRTMVDTDSMLELRPEFGHGIITCLARVQGKPLGIVANNPKHLGGAIDSPASDKAARFMQICDAFDIPLLFLCDTPGNMVGPEHEKTGLVRHCSRIFLIGANVSVPFFTIVLRKAYGLGALGMAGGGFHNPLFTISWPTGETGGMGLEGAVKLGHRKELEDIADPEERRQRYEELVAALYEKGKATSSASLFEIDDVIDPAESRTWISGILEGYVPPVRAGKKHAWIDAY